MANFNPDITPNKLKDLLYVRYADGSYRGWKQSLLLDNVEKYEQKFLLCAVCHGLLRDASLFENEGKQEIRCLLCLPDGIDVLGADINQESVDEKYVNCPLKESGCEWTDLITHVLSHLKECEFFLVECPLGCERDEEIVQVERRFLEEHQKSYCPLRVINCEACDSEEIACEMNEHIERCQEYLIPCLNSCVDGNGLKRFKRKDLTSHLEEDCPLQEVACPYAEYGCNDKMERNQILEHQEAYCLLRPIVCEFCKSEMRFCEMKEHLDVCEEFIVSCPNSCLEGEEIKGLKRKDLTSHLEEECPLEEVVCPYAEYGCSDKMERNKILKHQENYCPLRPIVCEFCKRNVRACEKNAHLDVCEEFVVSCPNSCMKERGFGQLKRKDLPAHLGEDCPLQQVACPYAEYGCDNKMERRWMDQHEVDYIHKHFKLTTTQVKNQSRKIDFLEEKCNEKDKEILRIEKELKNLLLAGSLNWKITQIDEKIRNKEVTYSKPFYVGLYKFQVKIRWHCQSPNWAGFFLYIMKGDWDDKLTWPFRYAMKFVLLDQYDQIDNRVWFCEISEEITNKHPRCFQKPIGLRNDGFGFFSCNEIQEEIYSRYDSILLKVLVERI